MASSKTKRAAAFSKEQVETIKEASKHGKVSGPSDPLKTFRGSGKKGMVKRLLRERQRDLQCRRRPWVSYCDQTKLKVNLARFWRLNMSTQIEDLYQRIQVLTLSERLELINRVFADLKSSLELQEELAGWGRLSDEALELFDKEL